MAAEIVQQLPSGPQAVVRARRALDALEDSVPARRLDDMRLIVSELVTNSLRHGPDEPGRPLRLHIYVRPRSARVEVIDSGPGFEPPTDAPGELAESGWGLMLVDSLADRWGVDRAGPTTVWAEVGLEPESRRAEGRAKREGRRTSRTLRLLAAPASV